MWFLKNKNIVSYQTQKTIDKVFLSSTFQFYNTYYSNRIPLLVSPWLWGAKFLTIKVLILLHEVSIRWGGKGALSYSQTGVKGRLSMWSLETVNQGNRRMAVGRFLTAQQRWNFWLATQSSLMSPWYQVGELCYNLMRVEVEDPYQLRLA